MDNFIVLYNPLAGNGTAQDKMRELESLMQGDRLYFSNMLDIRDYGAFFNDMPDGASIIICGGDGTLNRFLNDTEDIRPDCDIYYYPSGSGNDFARDIDAERGASPVLINRYIERLPKICVNGKEHRFINGIGYGIDRMIMLFCDAPAIRDVLLFPQMKPEVITRADIASQLPETTDNAAASVDALADDAEHGASNEAAAAHADAPALETGLTRDQAFDLLKKYNEDPFHIAHGQTLEGLMRYYAQKYDPANVEFWGQVGLLHDLDWEKFQDEVQHTVKTAELIEEAGGTKELARAIQTHNSDNNPDLPAPSCKMECVLFACDELSGLIQAAVLMRPSKSVMDFELKSLKKKFKDKRFAAGCDRDVIRKGAELNGMELDDLFASVIEAMKAIQPTCEGVE